MSELIFDRMLVAAKRGVLSRRQVLENGLKFGLSSAAIMTLMEVAPEAAAAPNPVQRARTSRKQGEVTGTFTMLRDGGAPDLDPHSQYDNAAQAILLGSHEMLIQFKLESTTEYEPMLAESWEASEDLSTYTFTIHSGVTFHDGTPCTAQSVKDSFDRFLLMNMGPVNVISRFAPDAAMWEVVDDVTIQFNLGKPQPLFLSAMSSSYGPMVLNTAFVEANKTEEDPWAHEFYLTGPAGTGTGPYHITKNEVNEEVVLEKFDAYYRGWENPHFDRLVVRVVAEVGTRRQLIETGDADATVQNLTAEDFTALQENPDVQVISGNSTAVYWTTMNAPRIGTVEARQGFSWAFPYEEVVQGVYQGRVIRTGPLATTVLGYDPDVFLYTTDLAKAKGLIEAGGHPEGTSFEYMINAGSAVERSVAELFLANLNEIGYSLDILEVDRSTFVDLAYGAAGGDERPHFFGGWGWWPDYNDAGNQLVPNFGSPEQGGFANAGLWTNDRFFAILDETENFTDQAVYDELMKEAQNITTELDPPAIFYGELLWTTALRSDIQGFNFNPIYLSAYPFYRMWRETTA